MTRACVLLCSRKTPSSEWHQLRRLGSNMHLLHRKSSPQELVLVDYDEDVAGSKLSLTLAWPRNPTRGGVHRVQGLHEQVGGFLQSIQIRSRSQCWVMILAMKTMVLVCCAAVFEEVRFERATVML